MWYIKDKKTGQYFTMFSTPHFTSNAEIKQGFDTEMQAVLCEEQLIHPDEQFLDRDTMPVFEC